MKALIYCLLCILFSGIAQTEISKEVNLYTNTIELPGTLSYVDTKKNRPLALFPYGSSPTYRNGIEGPMMQGNRLKMLTDSLNKNGIASYSYDKWTGNLRKADKCDGTLPADFGADVQQAAHRHMTDKRFSSLPITGQGQPSLVGMMTIDQHIRSHISLVGSWRPINEILVERVTKQDSTLGNIKAKHFLELAQTYTKVSHNTFLFSLFSQKNLKFIKNWISCEPFKKIERLKLPKLVVNWNMELQISEKEALVLQMARPSSILKIIPQMNHVIKTSVSLGKNLKSYLNHNFVISQYLIDVITSVIKNNE